MINSLINFALRNRFVVALNTLLLIAVGMWATVNLPIDAVPDVTNVQVQILTVSPALGPLEVEQFITFPVETALSGVPRVEEVRSVSQFGLSAVTVVFAEGTDIYWARQMVGERLLIARGNIPDGMGRPEMGPISTGLGEIYQFEVRSKPGYHHSLMERREILDWNIAYELRRVPGVIEVNTFGGQLKTYEVQLDPNKLLNYGVSISRVFEALKNNNSNAGGGYLVHQQEQRVIRGEGLIQSLADVADIVLDQRSDGTPIYVRDVGEVRFAPMLRQGAVTRDGRGEGVVGIVMLLMGENARTVVDRVEQKKREIEKTLPEGIEISTFYDRTELVRHTIATVTKNLIEGGVLVIVVLLLLLGSVRAGLIVALAVPLSMLGACIGMVLTGLSGNLMSLGAIDFGLIVDGSVVLIENIVRRAAEHSHAHPGERVPRSLIREACHEVARPVVFGVGIIMIVYLPILSLRGLEGKMFRPMAFTVIFALLTSLILALTLMPVLGSIFLRSNVKEKETFLIRWAKRLYRPLLAKAIAHPGQVVAIALVIFGLSVVAALQLGAVFVPRLDEGSLAIQAIRLPSVSLEASTQMTTTLEKVLMGFPQVTSVVSKTGRPEIANDPMTVNLTDVLITLKPTAEWPEPIKKEVLVEQMEAALKEALPNSNSFSFTQPIELRVQELVAGVRSDVGISLYGDDLAKLKATADKIAEVVGKVPGAADVQVEHTAGLPTLRVKIRRQDMARYGINASDVLAAVSAIGGHAVDQVFEGQKRFPLQIRLAPEWREDLDGLKQLKIADPQGRQIPLEQLADLTLEEGPAQISRDGGSRRILVQANVRGRDLAGFVAEAQRAVEAGVKLPDGYRIAWGGQFKNLQEASLRLMIAVPAALLLIFALLHLTFDSSKAALLIFLNVPMAVTGGVSALWLRGMPFSISAGVGFIALFGVAVLNGVVLLTSILEHRRRGEPQAEAVFNAAIARIRPVLMTALVAMLGFIPMAFATSSGAEVQQPLATVVIGGLVTSTLLTLFVVPAIYRWFEPRAVRYPTEAEV
ncbi:MAG: CusA/CzcA family heavy metal efflux RND transporter [Planctomycetia bacterium]|nr:CusA/CzcA family heavy metal efflux RND transporter [Planctomycetia bacterium]